MASKSKQPKLTSFFTQNKKDNQCKKQNQNVKFTKNQQLRQILNKMQSNKQTDKNGDTCNDEDNPYYAPILDKIGEERKGQQERLIAENKKHKKPTLNIEVLNGCKQNYFHGPTYGDRTDGKKAWKGYFEHRNKKMRKQIKNTDNSIYGDLSSNGVHFNKNINKKRKLNAENNDTNKKRKLNENNDDISNIFDGIIVYFNGRTNDLSSFHLNKVLMMNGGNFSVNSNSKVTHIVTTNLSRSKLNRTINRKNNVHYVRSEWITDSVKNGVKMKEDDYLVFKPNKYGQIKNYFHTQ